MPYFLEQDFMVGKGDILGEDTMVNFIGVPIDGIMRAKNCSSGISNEAIDCDNSGGNGSGCIFSISIVAFICWLQVIIRQGFCGTKNR